MIRETILAFKTSRLLKKKKKVRRTVFADMISWNSSRCVPSALENAVITSQFFCLAKKANTFLKKNLLGTGD